MNVAQTALFVAAVRARENRRPDRLFKDSLSEFLAGADGLAWLDRTQANPRSLYHPDRLPYLEVRTRYFDDWLQNAVGAGIRQFVLLGAGMDTRAFRLPLPPDLRVWEIDQLELHALKDERLRAAGAEPVCGRIPFAANLASPDWIRLLRETGFAPEEPSIWLAEGLFMYLPAELVHRLLEESAALAAPGSRLGAEFASEDLLQHRAFRKLMERRAARGTPFLFGTNDPEGLLGGHGWHADCVAQPGEQANGWGRWPYPEPPRSEKSFPRAFFVSASRSAPLPAGIGS